MSETELIYILPAVLTAFVICYMAIPVFQKSGEFLFELQKSGSDDAARLPESFAGLGIFTAVIISFFLWGNSSAVESYPFLVAALAILFMVGYKNDIMGPESARNLFLQFTAAVVLVFGGGLLISDAGGLFGFHELPFILDSALTVLIIVALINAFAHLDEVNGLGAGVAVIISGLLGVWFWVAGFTSSAILSFSLAASMTAFLAWSMGSDHMKLGKTGSMAIGFMMAFLCLEFIALNGSVAGLPFHIENAPVFLIALFIVPVLTHTVSLVKSIPALSDKISEEHSMFSEWTEFGISDSHVTFIFWMMNIVIAGISLTISGIDPNLQIAALLALGLITAYSVKIAAKLFPKLLSESHSANKERN